MYKVTIKARGESFKVSLCETKAQFKRLTVKDLWEKITEKDDDYDSENAHLRFRNRWLDEDDSLYDVGIRNGSEIYLEMLGPHFKVGSSSSRTCSMDRLADFNSCVPQ